MDVLLPLGGDVRKVVFDIAGYCGAEFLGPFVERDEPIDVALRVAGTVLVDVIDSKGGLLSDRLVFCHPLKDDPADGLIAYQTTRWAVTDDRGRATIQGVIPGGYNLVTGAIAEWREATTSGVQVVESVVTVATLNVPVMEANSFGGFTMEWEQAKFLEATPSGVVRNYAFWTAEGDRYKMFVIGKTVRCIVPGEQGAVVSGRIQWRSSSGSLQLLSRESDVVRVTVGAVQPIRLGWSEATGK
jgi:hypothetical protein